MSTGFIYPVILSGGSGTRLWPLSRSFGIIRILAVESRQNIRVNADHLGAFRVRIESSAASNSHNRRVRPPDGTLMSP